MSKDLKDLILEYVKQKSTDNEYDYSGDIVLRWEEIVGPKLYLKVFLKKVEKNSITVSCETPSYKTLVKMKEKEILRNISKYFPEYDIKRIQIV